jgi:hypothetical protein
MSPHLPKLLDAMRDDGVPTLLAVNSDELPQSVRQAQADVGWGSVEHRPGQTIYQEWNEAAEWACSLDAHLLVLNDDIDPARHLSTALGTALDEHGSYGLISADAGHPFPQSTIGAELHPAGFRLGARRAFAAWAFIARPAAWQMIGDYEVWYGDDDLIAKVEAAGWDVGYQRWTGVGHDTSCTTRQLPWTNEAVARDHARWVASGQG